MARFYDLLKSRTIDFNKLLLDQYIKLGLDEIDYVILSKLYFDLQTGNEYLDAEKLCSTMSISKEACSERIVSLVNRGFISLELSSISAKEVYSLNDLFENAARNPKDEEGLPHRRRYASSVRRKDSCRHDH